MSDELPADVRRALDRAAAGYGRTPTAAHPDCICGKLTGELSVYLRSYAGWPMPLRYSKADCPQHRPDHEATP